MYISSTYITTYTLHLRYIHHSQSNMHRMRAICIRVTSTTYDININTPSTILARIQVLVENRWCRTGKLVQSLERSRSVRQEEPINSNQKCPRLFLPPSGRLISSVSILKKSWVFAGFFLGFLGFVENVLLKLRLYLIILDYL
jgi:hypothetical protein